METRESERPFVGLASETSHVFYPFEELLLALVYHGGRGSFVSFLERIERYIYIFTFREVCSLTIFPLFFKKLNPFDYL